MNLRPSADTIMLLLPTGARVPIPSFSVGVCDAGVNFLRTLDAPLNRNVSVALIRFGSTLREPLGWAVTNGTGVASFPLLLVSCTRSVALTSRPSPPRPSPNIRNYRAQPARAVRWTLLR